MLYVWEVNFTSKFIMSHFVQQQKYFCHIGAAHMRQANILDLPAGGGSFVQQEIELET